MTKKYGREPVWTLTPCPPFCEIVVPVASTKVPCVAAIPWLAFPVMRQFSRMTVEKAALIPTAGPFRIARFWTCANSTNRRRSAASCGFATTPSKSA
jgi:hypothetical protein